MDLELLPGEVKDERGLPKLLKCKYEHRPATLLFDYPPQCRLPSRCDTNVLRLSATHTARYQCTFKVAESAHTYNCILRAFLYNGFTPATDNSFVFLISGPPKPGLISSLLPYQRLNHFPNSLQLGRKDCFWKNMDRMRRRFGREYELVPETFLLPTDFDAFETARAVNSQLYWIRKPVASSCGRGVKVISGTSRVRRKG